MKALYKKELRAFLSSIIGTVVLAVFLMVSGLFHWVFPGQWNLLNAGVAEMSGFFLFTPWIFLFLIPAITMRSIAEERKNGTLELLLTHPLNAYRIVWSKFLAGTTLVALALLPTLFGYGVLHILGNPPGNIDGGSVIAGYFGLILLGAAFVATGLLTSSRTDSQVVAFLSSALVCMIVYYGPSALGSYALFGSADIAVQWFAMETHFRSIGTGIIVVSDAAWCAAYITIALALAQRNIQPGRA